VNCRYSSYSVLICIVGCIELGEQCPVFYIGCFELVLLIYDDTTHVASSCVKTGSVFCDTCKYQSPVRPPLSEGDCLHKDEIKEMCIHNLFGILM